MKRNLRKLFMVSVAIFGIGGSADVFAVNDKSVTDEQTENLIYNPNFSLVRENSYCELIGWNVHDKMIPNHSRLYNSGQSAIIHAMKILEW